MKMINLQEIKNLKNLKELTVKKATYIFLATALINFTISGALYYFNQFQSFRSEISKISDFTVSTLKEKNIELKIKKDDIELNSDSILIETKDFPISLKTKNLIYVSKNANLGDFNNKDVVAIMNSKELVFKFDGEYQNVSLSNFLGDASEIVINSESAKNYVEKMDLKGNGFAINLLLAFSFERLLVYIIQFFWGFLILTYCVYWLLKLSGYVISFDFVRTLSILFYGLFLVLEPIVSFLKLPVNFVHVFIVGFFGLGLYLKFSLDKELKTSK